MIIDTHTHIYSDDYKDDAEQVMQAAAEAGILKHVLCNVDQTTIESVLDFHNRFIDSTYVAMGMHPTSVDADFQGNLKKVGDALFDSSRKYVAVGEIGVDLYWDTTFKDEQIRAFETQVDWAIELDLPLILHTRKAHSEVFASLKKFNKNHIRGVLHCFSGGIEEAKKAISMGFKLGIGGVVTYKNGGLPEILEQLRLEDLMLETDAPYLPPVPYRGKRNEPKYLLEIRDKIASIYNVSGDKVEEITSKNAIELFQL